MGIIACDLLVMLPKLLFSRDYLLGYFLYTSENCWWNQKNYLRPGG